MKLLVRQAQHGNPEAFVELIEANKQSLMKVAYGFFNSEEDAADAVSDTILDAYEHIRDLKKADYFKTWLIRILINNCNRIYNRNKKILAMDTMDTMDMMDTIQDARMEEAANSNVEFMELLRSLPEDSRLIFQLYYGEQFTTKEISKLLQMKESTVKSRLHRGKEQIRIELQCI